MECECDEKAYLTMYFRELLFRTDENETMYVQDNKNSKCLS